MSEQLLKCNLCADIRKSAFRAPNDDNGSALMYEHLIQAHRVRPQVLVPKTKSPVDPRASEPPTYSTAKVCELTGATEGALANWYITGLLPERVGYEWTQEALIKVEVMVRLVAVGFREGPASQIADKVVANAYGEGIAVIDLSHGLFLHQDRSIEYVKSVIAML